MIYSSWNIEQNILKVVILAHLFAFFRYFAFFFLFWIIFCTFTPLKTQNIKILKKWKKTKTKNKKNWRYYHFTINDNHMMYRSWDTERDRQNFLSFWTIFRSFTLLKNQNFEKMKIPGDIKWQCKWHRDNVPKIMIICYTVPVIQCMTDVILIFYFELFFTLLPMTQKIKILKKWKKYLEISSFYTWAPKIMITWCTVPEIWCTTDEQTEKVTYRGGCPT